MKHAHKHLIAAALLLGLGINCMHYTGMAAMRMEPGIVYDPLTFAASVLIAIAAASGALWIAFRLRQRTPRARASTASCSSGVRSARMRPATPASPRRRSTELPSWPPIPVSVPWRRLNRTAGAAVSAGAVAITADAPSHYFRMMKELALLGYFTSEIGYTQAMRYIESPGRFDPCAPYAPGEKAWAPHA